MSVGMLLAWMLLGIEPPTWPCSKVPGFPGNLLDASRLYPKATTYTWRLDLTERYRSSAPLPCEK